jgi:hypothetical protein
MLWYAILMFIVFPIGIPTFFFTILYRKRRAIFPGNAHKVLRVRHDYLDSEQYKVGMDTFAPNKSVLEVNGSNLTPLDHRMLRQQVHSTRARDAVA